MSYLELIKELLGKKGTIIVALLILGGSIVYYAPKCFVTVPVFAESMQKVYRQMERGDWMQEIQWIEIRLRDLRKARREAYNSVHIKELDEEIASLERKKEHLNNELNRSRR